MICPTTIIHQDLSFAKFVPTKAPQHMRRVIISRDLTKKQRQERREMLQARRNRQDEVGENVQPVIENRSIIGSSVVPDLMEVNEPPLSPIPMAPPSHINVLEGMTGNEHPCELFSDTKQVTNSTMIDPLGGFNETTLVDDSPVIGGILSQPGDRPVQREDSVVRAGQ